MHSFAARRLFDKPLFLAWSGTGTHVMSRTELTAAVSVYIEYLQLLYVRVRKNYRFLSKKHDYVLVVFHTFSRTKMETNNTVHSIQGFTPHTKPKIMKPIKSILLPYKTTLSDNSLEDSHGMFCKMIYSMSGAKRL